MMNTCPDEIGVLLVRLLPRAIQALQGSQGLLAAIMLAQLFRASLRGSLSPAAPLIPWGEGVVVQLSAFGVLRSVLFFSLLARVLQDLSCAKEAGTLVASGEVVQLLTFGVWGLG